MVFWCLLGGLADGTDKELGVKCTLAMGVSGCGAPSDGAGVAGVGL